MIKYSSYNSVRDLMKPGDIIAFGGKGHFSDIIKWATRSVVSHVGIVLHTKMIGDDTDRYFNEIMESTTLNKINGKAKKGVQRNRLSDRISGFDGEIWWLPLKNPLSDPKKFWNFLLSQDGKDYDYTQAVGSALDRLIPNNKEDFDRFFCSELAAAALEHSGMIGPINSSEITPIELCKWNIFDDTYHQIKGQLKKIDGYNSRDPR